MEKEIYKGRVFEELFNSIIKRKVLLKEEKFLSFDFLPRILHRDGEIKELMLYCTGLVTNCGERAVNLFVRGGRGVGKTSTVKYFCNNLKKLAQRRGVNLKYIHINCRRARTEYRALIQLISALNINIPQRGYSPQDLLGFLRAFLEKEDMFLILVLDELDSLDKKGAELLYSLVRINDDVIETKVSKRLNIIGIIGNAPFSSNLVKDIHHYFLKNAIVFEKYTKTQIFDILKQRAHISINENVISDKILRFMAEIVYENGDVRCGINILWNATKLAENKGLGIVTLNCVTQAYQDLVPYAIKDKLIHMADHKLLLLYTITVKLQKNGNLNISLTDAFKDYKDICNLSGIPPRAYSQVWNYIQECKKDTILKVDNVSKGIRGRRTIIEMPDIPLNKLVLNITRILESREISL